MSGGVNKVILIGNLGRDPETTALKSGAMVARFSIATSESWKDKQTGQQQQRTEWHRIVLFDRLAEIAQTYLKKGAKVYISGRLQTRKWVDEKNGNQERTTTEIVANELQMLDGRNAGGDASGFGGDTAGTYGEPGAMSHVGEEEGVIPF